MRRLLIFVKEPVPGQVKTRLAAEIGLRLRRSALLERSPSWRPRNAGREGARPSATPPGGGVPASVGADAACQIYRRCVERTLERLTELRDDITLCVEPAEATGRIQAWLGSAWSVQPQRGATLGDRLTDATSRTFKEGAHRIVVIGTDSPWLDHLRIEEAFSAMERADLALGPAMDGGYYLVGLAKPVPGLFRGIAWSTSQVLDQTLANARALSITVSLLPEGYDIDRLTDLQRWIQEDPQHGMTVPSSIKRGTAPRMRPSAHRARHSAAALMAAASEEV